MNLQNNKLKNFTPLPNEIFSLHLSTGELATYAVLMRLEDPRSYECWPSYETIGKAIGKSSVAIITLLNANPFIFIIVLKKFISVLGLQIQTTR